MKKSLLLAIIGIGVLQIQSLSPWWSFGPSERQLKMKAENEEKGRIVRLALQKEKNEVENRLINLFNETDDSATKNIDSLSAINDSLEKSPLLYHFSNDLAGQTYEPIAEERKTVEKNLIDAFKVEREEAKAAKKIYETFPLNRMVYNIHRSPNAFNYLQARGIPVNELWLVDAVKDEIIDYLEKNAEFVQSPNASNLEKDAYAKLVNELVGFLEPMKHVPDNGYVDFYKGRSQDNKYGRYRKALEKYGQIASKIGYEFADSGYVEMMGFDENNRLKLLNNDIEIDNLSDLLNSVRYSKTRLLSSLFDKKPKSAVHEYADKVSSAIRESADIVNNVGRSDAAEQAFNQF